MSLGVESFEHGCMRRTKTELKKVIEERLKIYIRMI